MVVGLEVQAIAEKLHKCIIHILLEASFMINAVICARSLWLLKLHLLKTTYAFAFSNDSVLIIISK